MKALLTLLLLISVVANVVLLSGCASVSGTVVKAPPEFSGDELRKIRDAIPDEYRDQFDAINSYVASQRGKTIIVIDPSELEDHDKVFLYIKK